METCPRCIRLLAHAWMETRSVPPVHPYLRQAAFLRPERSGHI